MVTFDRASGNIGIDSACIGVGYSGAPGHVGVCADEALHALGPIPAGRWIIGDPYDHPVLGPCCMNLTPAPGTETFGRGDFRIHADNASKPPKSSSEGCLVASHDTRARIAAYLATSRELVVT